MPQDEALPKQAAKKVRANRTYKKRLTKKQLKIRKRKALTILAAIVIGASVISGYGEATSRYLERLNTSTGSIVVREAKASPAPEIELIDVSTGTIREVTAYNLGDPAQTDDSPCITATGQDGCKLLEQGINICAANFVPLGTTIYVDHFGECLVIDRMASKHPNRVDIGMKLSEHQRAIKFGLQNLIVKIVE
jgi:3D (Asp-Asp-Asp) domain-containing protein